MDSMEKINYIIIYYGKDLLVVYGKYIYECIQLYIIEKTYFVFELDPVHRLSQLSI